MNLTLNLHFTFFFCLFFFVGNSQEINTVKKRKSRFVALPATAYTPETGLTFGVIGDYFFDLAHGSPVTRMSKFSFTGIYTTKKQLYFLSEWQLFTPGEDLIFKGIAKYSNFIDRNYGLGNDVSMVVSEFNPETQKADTLKFLNYNFSFYSLRASINKNLTKSYYAGFIFDFENAYNFTTSQDSVNYLAHQSSDYVPFEGIRSGVGLKFTYDTRKNINNPRRGTYLQVSNITYGNWLGSDYNYTSLTVDLRQYINTYKDQTLALRLLWDQRFAHSADNIPLRAYSTAGGKDFLRGYFEGTYRDKYMLGLQTEYRVPLWLDETAPALRIWKRLGIVIFASMVQAQPDYNSFDINEFHFAVGGGLRYMLDTKQRVNIRIDYGVGLDKNAGYDGRQTGLYFYLSEAF